MSSCNCTGQCHKTGRCTTTTTDGQLTMTWVLEAKFKELTDEEIWETWKNCYQVLHKEKSIEFAKAILRKAQE